MAEMPEYVVTGGYKRRFYLRPFTGTEVFCFYIKTVLLPWNQPAYRILKGSRKFSLKNIVTERKMRNV